MNIEEFDKILEENIGNMSKENFEKARESFKQNVLDKEKYYDMHKYCPKCGSDKHSTTYVAYLFTDLETFKDENAVGCQCGWKGICHDLVGEKK